MSAESVCSVFLAALQARVPVREDSRLLCKVLYAKARLAICQTCENVAWLKDSEFAMWVNENKIEVLKNLEALEKLSDLPKKPHRALTRRYCVKCKCNILAKVHSREEMCPETKWV